jgi:DNA invertase Pin-like site-specific DNA recombinase
MPEIKYVADLYLRLSKDDGDKEESDSIANQRLLIEDFLKSMPDITVHNVHVDDGYSGVDFIRPGFIAMMEDIKAGIVNCVVVKDFSRFGRNYIEAGRYIQVLFPRTGVRFIAINDAYDSAKTEGYANNIIVPFKNMVNDAYCADISVKVRSHLEIKRKKGDFVGAFAVYGYTKIIDENKKKRLVIDDFAADVVRDIFKWKLEGLSAQCISEKLNSSGVLSPLEYKRFLGMKFTSNFKVNNTAKWTAKAVFRILENAVYTGVLEQGKRTKPNYKVRALSDVPKEKWICHEGTHDAIIDRTTFKTVQELLRQDTRATKKGSSVYPLSGVIVCGDCGAAMVRKTTTKGDKVYPYYVCSKHRSDTSVCSTHMISFTECEKAVLVALRSHTSAVLDVEKALASAVSAVYAQDAIRKLTARLEVKRDELKKYNSFRLFLYESYREAIIPKEDFISFKATYDEKIAEAEAAAQVLKEEIESLAAGETKNIDWIDRFKAFAGAEILERRNVAELIESVRVFEDNRIEITFRYLDEYNQFLGPREAGALCGERSRDEVSELSHLCGSEGNAVRDDEEAV